MENLNQKFMKEISNTKDPVIFLGLATILKIELYGKEKDENDKPIPKDFSVLFKEMMASYDCAGRKRKKELLKILREANKTQGGVVDGSGTKNTETSIQDEKVQ